MSLNRKEAVPTISPFAEFLSEPTVFNQLQKNISGFITIHPDIPVLAGNIGRYFNDFPPVEYKGIQPLLDTVLEAAINGEFCTWLDFAVYIAMTDLFDAKANLLPEIYILLNARETGNTEGSLDLLFSQHSAAAINTQLLASYLVFLSDRALTILYDNIYRTVETDNIPDCLDRIDTKCTLEITRRSQNVVIKDSLDISALKKSLIMMSQDDSMKSSHLRKEIQLFLDQQEKTAQPVASLNNSMTLFVSDHNLKTITPGEERVLRPE